MTMKKALFYTILFQFWLVCIIMFLGISHVISINEGYLNTFVAVFVAELGASVIALFKKTDFFSDEKAKIPPESKTKVSALSASQPQPSSSINTAKEKNALPSTISAASAVDYFSSLEALSDRFFEKEEFVKNTAVQNKLNLDR